MGGRIYSGPSPKGCRRGEKEGAKRRELELTEGSERFSYAQTKPDPFPWHDAKGEGRMGFPAALPRVQLKALAPPFGGWGKREEQAGWVGGYIRPEPKGCGRGKGEGAKRGELELTEGSARFSYAQTKPDPFPWHDAKGEERMGFPAALPRVQLKALAPNRPPGAAGPPSSQGSR